MTAATHTVVQDTTNSQNDSGLGIALAPVNASTPAGTQAVVVTTAQGVFAFSVNLTRGALTQASTMPATSALGAPFGHIAI